MDFARYNLTRDQYLTILEEVICKSFGEPRCMSSFIFNNRGKERCNAMGCKKVTKLKEHNNYKVCSKHFYISGGDDVSKQSYILKNLFLQVLAEIDKFKSIAPVKKSIQYKCKVEKKSLSLKKICGRVDCEKRSVFFRFGDLFCSKHIHEIEAIRIFKRIELPLEQEIALREMELLVRKKKDSKHEWYLEYLKRKLIE